MSDHHLLSELCSICHTQPPKYRCPRCQTKTCSLACVKRHKSRAQCSGQRDPTAYVKKRHLGTAAGIDHDFNFIRSVERGIDSGTDLLHEHGYDDQRKWQKHFAALQRRIGEVGVVVQKAPAGLSRAKENATHWGVKTRSILWTVEWILEDQSRCLDSFSEHTAVEVAHQWLLARLDKKRRDDAGEVPVSKRQAKRRKNRGGKLDMGAVDQASSAAAVAEKSVSVSGQAEIAGQTETPVKGLDTDSADPPPQPMADGVNETIVSNSTSETRNVPAGSNVNEPDVLTETTGADAVPSLADDKTATEPSPPPKPTHHFYLIKPRTTFTANAKVLIPLTGETTLATCLKGQLILEFPSIQVLSYPADSLPNGYITAATYSDLEKKGREKLTGQPSGSSELSRASAATAEVKEGSESSSEGDSDVDENDDLDVNIDGFIPLDGSMSKSSVSTVMDGRGQDSRISNVDDLMAIQRDLVG